MAILDHWNLELTVEDVFRAQGADPVILRQRKPSLVEQTEKAINLARSLLQPRVLYAEYPVKRFIHGRLELAANADNHGKSQLEGELIAKHLANAQSIIVLVCTIGGELDESVSSLFKVDPVMAVALDGVGSAAVELLAIQAANHFEAQAKQKGLKTTMPLNPGMVGWPVEEGQLQIFTLLESEQIQVSLTESFMMTPNKSLSMVLGIGDDVSSTGTSCDYCALKGVCKYQNHYA